MIDDVAPDETRRELLAARHDVRAEVTAEHTGQQIHERREARGTTRRESAGSAPSRSD